jgi:hypothetical protein
MTTLDVHTAHCCSRHGCKYGDPNCTVVTGRAPQEYMDEQCAYELEDGGLETAYLMNEMYDKGRLAATQ